jgi:hypothetical protein
MAADGCLRILLRLIMQVLSRPFADHPESNLAS